MDPIFVFVVETSTTVDEEYSQQNTPNLFAIWFQYLESRAILCRVRVRSFDILPYNFGQLFDRRGRHHGLLLLWFDSHSSFLHLLL